MNRCTRSLNSQNRTKTFIVSASAIVMGALLTGCGMGPYGYKNSKNSYGYAWQDVGGSFGNNSGGSTSGAGGTTTSGSGTAVIDSANGGSIPQIRKDAYGQNSISFSVTTGNKLRIRFVPGRNDKNFLDQHGNQTGWFYQYSKLQVSFVVNGQTFTTDFLSNGLSYSGSSQAESQIIDLSSAIGGNACTRPGVSCQNTVQIVINEPKYDFCFGWGSYGCPPRAVDPGKPWNVRLQVETNDTAVLK